MPPVAYDVRKDGDHYEASIPEHPADATRRALNNRWRDFHRAYWLLGVRHDRAKAWGHGLGVLAVVLGLIATFAPLSVTASWAVSTASVIALIVSFGAFWQASRYLKAWRALRSPAMEHRT